MYTSLEAGKKCMNDQFMIKAQEPFYLHPCIKDKIKWRKIFCK